MNHLTVESTEPVSIFRWHRAATGGWVLYHHTSSDDRDGMLVGATTYFDAMYSKVKRIVNRDVSRWWLYSGMEVEVPRIYPRERPIKVVS